MGEDACFLSSVCLSCGRFIDDAESSHRCPHCGDPLYRAGPVVGPGATEPDEPSNR